MGAYCIDVATLEEAPSRFPGGRMGLAGVVAGGCNIWHHDKTCGGLCVTPVRLVTGQGPPCVWARRTLHVEDVVRIGARESTDVYAELHGIASPRASAAPLGAAPWSDQMSKLLDCPRGLFPARWGDPRLGPSEVEQAWIDSRQAWLEDRVARSTGHYVLVDREPIPEPDIVRWSAWFEKADDERQVALTTLADGSVLSTVFMSIERRLPHAVRPKQPLLFETLRSDSSGVVSAAWFETWELALAFHESLVAEVAAEVARKMIGSVS